MSIQDIIKNYNDGGKLIWHNIYGAPTYFKLAGL
jgi:hypothetical protein